METQAYQQSRKACFSYLGDVLNPFLLYATFLFPQNVCSLIDRATRDFIWQGNANKGLHLVDWNKISRPKKVGGLRVRAVRETNSALLSKLVWDMLSPPDKLWVKLLTKKCVKNRSFMDDSLLRGSFIWNSILKAKDALRDGFYVRIGSGESSL